LPALPRRPWPFPSASCHLLRPCAPPSYAAQCSKDTALSARLAPAWQSTRVQVNSSLKDSGQAVVHRRRGLGGKATVTPQVSLSMLLVVGAGLFVRTLVQLGHSPLGFKSHNLLLSALNFRGHDTQKHRVPRCWKDWKTSSQPFLKSKIPPLEILELRFPFHWDRRRLHIERGNVPAQCLIQDVFGIEPILLQLDGVPQASSDTG